MCILIVNHANTKNTEIMKSNNCKLGILAAPGKILGN